MTLLEGDLPDELRNVEISLVARNVSGEIHDEFFQDASPTDVMTFPSGDWADIIICPEVADEQRVEHGTGLYEELLTYAVHGLLHLTGLDDLTEVEFEVMKKRQDEVLKKILE